MHCRMSLAVEHGYLLIEEAMEIARKTAAGLAQADAQGNTCTLTQGDTFKQSQSEGGAQQQQVFVFMSQCVLYTSTWYAQFCIRLRS